MELKKYEITLNKTDRKTVVVDAFDEDDAKRMAEKDPDNHGWTATMLRAYVPQELRLIVGTCRCCFGTVFADQDHHLEVLEGGFKQLLHEGCRETYAAMAKKNAPLAAVVGEENEKHEN